MYTPAHKPPSDLLAIMGKAVSINPLCVKYNIMRLVSNNEIKMSAHRRNSAYYVFVLYDHFLRTNDEYVECSLWRYHLGRGWLSLMLFEMSVQVSAAREKGLHILQLFSRLNSDTKGCSAVCCHLRTFPIPLEPILEFACTLVLHTPVRMWVHHCALCLVVAWALQVGLRV